jgi:transcriptional regulator with XRE-family HTH domain
MSAGTTYSAIIGNIIKQLRASKSIKQGEIAEKMGVSQAAWSKLESGKSTLSTAQLAKVADILNISANQIILHADNAAANFRSEGMTVTYDNKEAENTGLMLLGAAAIGVLIALVVFGKK